MVDFINLKLLTILVESSKRKMRRVMITMSEKSCTRFSSKKREEPRELKRRKVNEGIS